MKPKHNMNIEITSLLELDCFNLSHSAAEGGQDACRNTWNASKAAAAEMRLPLLDTEEKLDSMREFAKSSGGWTREEIAEWSAEEINALFLQWIAGDVRQCPAVETERADSLDKIDWLQFEEKASAGQIPSNLSKGDDGKIWFYLGC